ncbi:MAG TPA: c-type cytochrome domain-containing protein, partial [Candidatus Acidoferrum sp.]|nr:c-type cytochrome domain-containing protein [Candidatus Acidoferrum sp.]
MVIFLTAAALQNLFAADAPQTPPPPANITIDFDRDIRPILEDNCLRCHGPQKPKSHFRLDYRDGALAGGDDNTNDIVPDDSTNSLLIAYVAHQVPDMEMPPVGRGKQLTPEQISLLRAWIDQG